MNSKNATKIIVEKGKQELFIIREFDAPREQVCKAFTHPEILVKFFAPPGVEMVFETGDFRTGGCYRYSHVTPDGKKNTAFGVIHELRAPERMVQTFEFAGMPEGGHVVLETLLFEGLPGNRTKLTIHDVCRSLADRDAMIESGMESGLTAIFNQLDQVLTQDLVNQLP
jgi:uncharacterized protein YndB with AHSA1/START domain